MGSLALRAVLDAALRAVLDGLRVKGRKVVVVGRVGLNAKGPARTLGLSLFTALIVTNRVKLNCTSAGFLILCVLWVVDGFCTGEGA